PGVVPPSSHSSPVTHTPLPQNSVRIGVQGSPTTRHSKPFSTSQVSLHPSPDSGVAAPSSHCSPWPIRPSPQMTVVTCTHPDALQDQPSSTSHSESQPSPVSSFPSSQASPPMGSYSPLPHSASTTQGSPGVSHTYPVSTVQIPVQPSA